MSQTPADIFESTLALLEGMTAISSPSGDIPGLQAANRHFGQALEARGLSVEIASEETSLGPQPVLYARGPRALQADDGEGCLLLVGHLDTVLPAITPQRRAGGMLATGAIDMKGGLAAFVGALALLEQRGQRPSDDLFMVIVPDEEVAGELSHKVLTTYGPKARALWVLEPGRPAEQGETMVLGRRGMFHWQLRVTGQGAHAGNAYWQGRSALTAAADWCLAVRALARPGKGPTVNAGRLVAGEQDFVDNLASQADLIGTSRQINVVPNLALVEGEARFLNASDGDRLIEAMGAAGRRLAEEHGVTMDFEVRGRIAPLDPNGPGQVWARKAVALAAEGGWHLEVEEDRGGISFPNFLPDPSLLPILDGLGPVGGGMHTRDEFIDLESLDRRITLLADLLAADAEVNP